MEHYTTEQRTKIIEFYFGNQRSIILTQRAYRRFFHDRNGPSEATINRLIARFRQQGAVSDLPRTGRPKTACTEENVQRVQESVHENPTTSTRRRSTQLRLSRRSIQRILAKLKMFPYKVQLVQELKPTDYQQRLDFAVFSGKKRKKIMISCTI